MTEYSTNTNLDQTETNDSRHSTAYLQLWRLLLSNCNHAQTLLRKKLVSDCALSLAQFDLLSALREKADGITMGELSSKLFVSNANVTGLVSRMQKDDLVKRWALTSDRRVYFVAITEKGLNLHNAAKVVYQECLDSFSNGIEKTESEQLVRLLESLKHSVDHYGDTASA